eukprot:gnl/TRDRNA2_/TRDRNA2_79439_c1_seq2.p1 gnl/TRDRNA2_/TRDRNA2_79439_c1~~gnl/TRDRNA2_/TRDRNA2_79439_c1_seq2.p1  ORF type:complete len:119 (+),score=11.43 gnl/TRDRNA2_/TRDRNA2_79439_c1_seq2:215-571(+)
MVDVQTDHHAKRPVRVHIYNEDGVQVGLGEFPFHIGTVCHTCEHQYHECGHCHYYIALDQPCASSSTSMLMVVVDGLLCGANGYVLIENVRALGRATANDSPILEGISASSAETEASQ